jgi:hypothetical protein
MYKPTSFIYIDPYQKIIISTLIDRYLSKNAFQFWYRKHYAAEQPGFLI